MRDPLVAVLAAFQPDLVIISLGGTYDLLSYPALVTWLHSSRTPYCTIANWQEENPILPEADRERAREAFALARTVAFVSTRNLSATRRHLLHPLSNARVLQNPLRWTSADVAPWPVAPDWRLATVSRLDLGKGIQLLLHALAQELAGERDWRLNIYGQGPAADYLHTTVAYLRLGDRVQFRGHVGNLHTIWAENHLLCSPALNDGVPMTIPEAMLCGRPALATCVGGAEDWIRPGANGFLCPAPTLPLLADALRTAWEERDRWRELGQQAAIDARARYKPDDYLQVIAP
jgi:glycosyltransferase involved in cell wall biosynthesis